MIERPDAHNLIAGMSEDQTLRPTLLFGAGGTAAEVLKDRRRALPPLDLKLARDLMRQTRRLPSFLEGYRNWPAGEH